MKITFSLEFYNPISNCKFSLMNRKFDDLSVYDTHTCAHTHHIALYIRKFSNFSLITTIKRCYSGSSFALYRSHMSTNTAPSNYIKSNTNTYTCANKMRRWHVNSQKCGRVQRAYARARTQWHVCTPYTVHIRKYL